jgi:hypothetical protein
MATTGITGVSPVSGTRPLPLNAATAGSTRTIDTCPRTPAGTVEDQASKQPQSQSRSVTGKADYQRPFTDQLEDVVESRAASQYELVRLAAEFADSPEWILTGSPTAALEYNHVPAYEQTGHTIATELKLRCAPCHTNRHRSE